MNKRFIVYMCVGLILSIFTFDYKNFLERPDLEIIGSFGFLIVWGLFYKIVEWIIKKIKKPRGST